MMNIQYFVAILAVCHVRDIVWYIIEICLTPKDLPVKSYLAV